MRRKPGQLLPLEELILSIAAKESGEVYGFALATRMASEQEASRLVGHGTLYKALDRLREQRLLEARSASLIWPHPRREVIA
ncbi:MAG: helix-turn-helix transcriptional regulator [Acidobacteriota bacterium]